MLSLLVFGMWCNLAQAVTVPVYRAPNNPIATGHYDLELLKKHRKRAVKTSYLKVNYGRQSGWIADHLVWSIWDVSSQLMVKRHSEGEPAHPEQKNQQITIASNTPVFGLYRYQDKMMVQAEGLFSHPFWLAINDLKVRPLDLGKAITLGITQWYRAPSLNSPIAHTFKAGQTVRLQLIKGSWAEVQHAGQTGYIHLSRLLTRFKFAERVQLKSSPQKDHEVIQRRDDQLLVQGGKVVAYEDIQRITKLARVVYIKSQKARIQRDLYPRAESFHAPYLTPLQQNGHVAQDWHLSSLPDNTDVWWQYPPQWQSSATGISTRELFKQNITAIKTHPKNKTLHFASGQSIYRTFDGHIWHRVPEFHQAHLPIAIGQGGLILIGDKMSRDTGRSFQTYIPWHHIISVAQRKIGPIENLRVAEISISGRKDQIISLTLATATHTCFVKSIDQGKTWLWKGHSSNP